MLLLTIAAFFQFGDNLQITALGALRGLKDTRGPMLITLAGYWGLGLPTALIFGILLGHGPVAIWVSIVIGLTLVGSLLMWRYHRQSQVPASL